MNVVTLYNTTVQQTVKTLPWIGSGCFAYERNKDDHAMLSTNSPLLRSNLRKILIVCFIVAYGIIVRKLHLEAVERIKIEKDAFAVSLRDYSTVYHGDAQGLQVIEEVQHPKVATTNSDIAEFTHQEGGVIVTKVHGPHQLPLLQQSMCLLHQAYNHKVQYDIVVFTTLPIPDNDLAELRATIAPVKLTVVVDNEGIVQEIHKLSPVRRELFLKRCNVTSPEQINWDSECFEDDVGMGKIRYNWQAEFRSWHIWKHATLKKYKYMMWIDTDAFCTRVWERDPMAIAMKHDLVIYFDNYPQGRAKVAQPKVKQVFGNYLCSARKQPNGPMYTAVGDECAGSQLWTIHGFHHITNLDFFRSDKVLEWQEIMIGDCFLCRKFDDQLAVTVPSMMLVPERSWDMYRSGHKPNIFHNHKIDGKRNRKAGGFLTYWKDHAETEFPEAFDKCQIVAGS